MREGSRRSTGLLSVYITVLCPSQARFFLARGPLRVPRTPDANGNHFPSPYNDPFLPLLSYPLRPSSFLFLSLILSYPLRPPVFLLLILHLFSSLLSLAANRFFLFSHPHLSPITPTLLFPFLLLLYYYYFPHSNLLSTTTLSIEATALCTRALRARCN